jgi:hypothetical protein
MLSEQEFFAGVTGSTNDLALVAGALRATGQPFCLIGGLAVNQYAEPVVTLDADFALTASGQAAEVLRAAGFLVREFANSLNAQLPGSRLRIRITINSRYGDFPSRAVTGVIFGVEMPVACLEDVVREKLWAATDPARRASKRAKDAADLIRLAESHPQVFGLVPPGVIAGLDEICPAP